MHKPRTPNKRGKPFESSQSANGVIADAIIIANKKIIITSFNIYRKTKNRTIRSPLNIVPVDI